MSVFPIPRPQSQPTASVAVPALREGDRLNADEFLRRYAATPPGFRAQLIGGQVFVASPIHRPHSKPHVHLSALLFTYAAGTPGVEALNPITTTLSDNNVVEPDAVLFVLPSHGGSIGTDEAGPLRGAPELVVEISDSTAAVDLHQKRQIYRAGGVLEYLVFRVTDDSFHAFDLPADEPLKLARGGVWKSHVFPGLWLSPSLIFAGRSAESLELLQQGLATVAHARFAARLAREHQRRQSSTPPSAQPRRPRKKSAKSAKSR